MPDSDGFDSGVERGTWFVTALNPIIACDKSCIILIGLILVVVGLASSFRIPGLRSLAPGLGGTRLDDWDLLSMLVNMLILAEAK